MLHKKHHKLKRFSSKSINSLAPKNFAKKHVLKLVTLFSGHCPAIKPKRCLQVVHFNLCGLVEQAFHCMAVDLHGQFGGEWVNVKINYNTHLPMLFKMFTNSNCFFDQEVKIFRKASRKP